MTSMAFDEKHFSSTAATLAEVSDRGLSDVLAQFGKIVVEQCIRLTPPMNYATSLSESGQAQKRIGLNATAAGVHRAFKTANNVLRYASGPKTRSTYAHLARLMKTGKWQQADDLLNFYTPITGVGPNATPELHNSFRHKGRVPKNQWPYVVRSEPSIRRLLRKRQRKVGFAKSGWIPAAVALGSKLSGFSWIKGKGGEAFGGITLPSAKQKDLIVWNAVPYIQQSGRERRIVARAFESTIHKMEKATEIIMAKRMRKGAR